MYQPPQFQSKDRAQALQIMRAHPFASLISVDDAGLPFVTHLPLHVEMQGEQMALLGHCAKPNPHWQYLQTRPNAVVTFLGPHAYLSPQVYPDLARVPTWNYLAVHCTVEATLIEDELAKDRLLKKLIGDHEPRYAQQWRASEGDDRRQRSVEDGVGARRPAHEDGLSERLSHGCEVAWYIPWISHVESLI